MKRRKVERFARWEGREAPGETQTAPAQLVTLRRPSDECEGVTPVPSGFITAMVGLPLPSSP